MNGASLDTANQSFDKIMQAKKSGYDEGRSMGLEEAARLMELWGLPGTAARIRQLDKPAAPRSTTVPFQCNVCGEPFSTTCGNTACPQRMP